MNKIIKTLKLFFPERCPYCNAAIERGKPYCEACAAEFPQDIPAFFALGGFPCRAAFYYTGGYAGAVKRLKFKYIKALGAQLAVPLAECVRGFELDFDCVTCVPMYKKREKERGFNHAELIARETAGLIGVGYADLLVKIKDNELQHTLGSLSERRSNVKNVYRALDKERIKGKRILVIDDVFTTGCTIGECAKTLAKAGAGEVCCAVLCVRKPC